MSTPISAGQIVYTIEGIQVEYVAETIDGHIVRPFYDADDREPSLGAPELHRRVFDTEPAVRYSERTVALRAELNAVQESLRAAKQEVREFEAERKQLIEKLTQHPELSIIAAWIEGRLTHVASMNCGTITIQPIDEAVLPANANDRRNGEVRLLALYGGRKTTSSYYRDYTWQLNAYRDGSGSNTLCILGTSVDDVKDRLQKYLDTE